MDFLEKITKDTLVITDNKNDLLDYQEKIKRIINVKYMSFKELKDKFYFTYDINAIYYLMNNYKYTYDVSKMYLDNLIYIINKKYKSNKLNKLVSLKNDLDDNNILIYDSLFKYYLANVNVIFYGYDYFTLEDTSIIEEIKKITNVDIVFKEEADYIPVVYEFNTVSDEVNFVAKKISELLDNNIDINKIKLINVSDDYNNCIKKVFDLYNIPININNKIAISSTKVGKYFISNLKENVNETINELKEKFKNEELIINKIVNICNKYVDFNNYMLIKELLIHDLNNTYKEEIKYKNAITIGDLNDIYNSNDYVFLMNFNQKSMPQIKKDEDYITDNIKSELDMSLTYEVNKLEKESTIKNIKRIKNLVVTYKLRDLRYSYYPSNLIFNMDLDVLHEEDNKKIYSKKYMELELSKQIDNLIKYGSKSENLDSLYNTFNNNLYRSYNNKFKGIDKDKFYEYIDNKLTLSYSSLENYNECAFKYYINNILKLNAFNETFYTIIGTIFHHILEIGLLNDIDVKFEVKDFIKDKEFNNKELFFLDKLTTELIFILDVIKKQTKEIMLDNFLFEDEVIIEKGNNIKVTFKGYVDKIMYKNDIKTVAVLVDYKTGNTDISLNYVPYGLKMQLPIYLYLVKNKLKDVTFAGFYLQKILHNEETIENKTLEEQKINNLKLIGFSNSDEHILSMFDKNYTNSNLVAGLKVKADGNFYSTSKILNNNEINKLIDLTSKEVDKTISKIEDVNFMINPKKIGYGTNAFDSCTYCTFKDICFKTEEDVEKLDEIKDLSFLGGDNND